MAAVQQFVAKLWPEASIHPTGLPNGQSSR